MMRKHVNFSRPPERTAKFTAGNIRCTGPVSVTGCLPEVCTIFHTYTVPTTKNIS